MRTAIALLAVLGIVAGGAAAKCYVNRNSASPASNFRTAPIKRGDLLTTIGATGTIEPEELVDVGAQVMGRILEFGPDVRNPSKSVDYNSVVEKGALLAKIDPTPYKAALEQAEAMLQQSEANLLQLKAKLRQSEREWKRAEILLPKKAIADTDYDTALSNYESAKANVTAGVAAIRQNKACVNTAKINLGYCTIYSPVHGTIIERRVNVGQTMVASLNAPSLFLIGKDLSKMQVWASVNEANIGRIRLNMPARFTVDAHDGETFDGTVAQIRMNAQMTQNVVTFTVIVSTDNSSGRLLPYLTANLEFEVDKRVGVLLAPNAALRWTPGPEQIDPDVNKAVLHAGAGDSKERGRLWVETRGGRVRPLDVTLGISDGTMTEVSGKGIEAGLCVVAGEEDEGDTEGQETATAGGDKTSNPFLPKPPKGSRPPPGPM